MTQLIHSAAATEPTLADAWAAECASARSARDGGDLQGECHYLERAHILSQPMVGRHVRTHVAMLGYGFRRRDRTEIVGQLIRVLVAAPGTLLGRYPRGNTGGANVSLTEPMTVPDDLRLVLERHNATKG